MTIGAGGGGSSGQEPKIEPTDYQQQETMALKQLREFFGPTLQEQLGRQALQSAKTSNGEYNLQLAMNWILDNKNLTSPNSQQQKVVKTTGTTTAQQSSASFANITKATQKIPVKETESNSDTELQKAIALSLTDQPQQTMQQSTPLGLGGQFSAEEQELSKVIEASIAESKKGAASHDLRQSSLFFIDPANPHERERQTFWPVGLKNVGNTCWFSVVIQALFHLPIFRRRLLNYDLETAMQKCQPVETAASSSASSSTSLLPRELEFAIELRKLFSLLLASRRKYVDPSGAVDVLRKQDSLQLRNIGGLDNGQQDVSEFTHLLLEWLEEAFKLALPINAGANAMETDATSQTENLIQQLFYGTFVKESASNLPTIVRDGGDRADETVPVVVDDVQTTPMAKVERFSQYPLQVVGCDTLHDSMERSLRPEDSVDTEHWLERLPPVFLFELTRFRYNQVDKKPEKLHSKFRFPKVLYVDRYMKNNKAAIREKRVHVGRLREQLNALRYQLEKVENFNGKKLPLAEVLRLTLKYVGKGDDVDSVSCSESMESENVVKSILSRPIDASEAELEVIDRALNRWRARILEDVDELKRNICEVEAQIERVYLEPIFQQHPYVLHAVLVHEGQATLGHYWTFVHDRKTDSWRKFNDVQVTDVSYEEVERDSIGDFQSTSAYCLMYVDVQKGDIFEGHENPSETQLLAGLLPDLQRYVSDDNARFNSEISDWDRKQMSATPSAPTPSPTGGAPTVGQRGGTQIAINEAELAIMVEEHGRLCARQLQSYVHDRLNNMPKAGEPSAAPSAEVTLHNMIEEKVASTKRAVDEFLASIGYNGSGASEPNWHACTDARTHHGVPFYAYCWIRCGGGKRNAPFDETRVLRRIVLDYFANVILVGPNTAEGMTEVYQSAKRGIASFGPLSPGELQVYGRIYYDYQLYLETLVLLAHAVEKLNTGHYVDALNAIICTKNYAERLATQSQRAGGVDFALVLECCRAACMHLSEQTVKEILTTNDDKEVVEKVQLMKTQLLPCVADLFRRHHDSGTLESVRAGWLAAVVDEENVLPEPKGREVRDFLEALMEVDTSTTELSRSKVMNAKIKLQPDIGIRFTKAMRSARELGILHCRHGST